MSVAAMLKYADWTEANRALRALNREKGKAKAEPKIARRILPMPEVPEPYVSEREPLWFPSNAPVNEVMIAALDFDPIQHHGAMFLHVEGTLTARIDDRDAYLAAIRRLYGYRGSLVKRDGRSPAAGREALDRSTPEAFRVSLDRPDLSVLSPDSRARLAAIAAQVEAASMAERPALVARYNAAADEYFAWDAPQVYGQDQTHTWGVEGLMGGRKVRGIYSGTLAALRWLWPDAETRRIMKKAGCLNLDDLGIPLQIDDRTGLKCFDYYRKCVETSSSAPAGVEAEVYP